MDAPYADMPPPRSKHPAIGAYDTEWLGNARPPDWRNPEPGKRYHLLVIGAEPAALTTARVAAKLGAQVALVAAAPLGGDCMNHGSIPSKALIRTSRLYAEVRHARHFGASIQKDVDVDFGMAMERVRGLRARISRRNSAARLVADGVDLYFGDARFTSPTSVEIDGRPVRFKKALVATGSNPMLPDIPGLAEAGCLTNDAIFDLTAMPKSLCVIGGGSIGCELAQMFARFGCRTVLVHKHPLFLPGEDRDAAQLVSDFLGHDGIEIRLNTEAVKVRTQNGRKIVEISSNGHAGTIEVDEILSGIGRAPAVEGLGLEAAGIDHDRKHGIHVDDFLRTTNRRAYAAGDVCQKQKFTDTADVSASIVIRNALVFGRQRLSAITIPWCTYTDPEIAHVGLFVRQARDRGIPVKTFTVPMHDVDRATADGEDIGFVKVHVREGTDRIVGSTIVSRHASHLISYMSLAMTAKIGFRTVAQVIHAYPTQAESIKQAANNFVWSRMPWQARLRRWVYAWQARRRADPPAGQR